MHRDLKPANVKVTPDGTVKVLDFGLAKAVTGAAGSDAVAILNSPTVTSPAMTGRGVILGTAAYMSPEQARGLEVGPQADIWALGCILFELVTGRRPFSGPTVTDVLAAVVRADPEWSHRHRRGQHHHPGKCPRRGLVGIVGRERRHPLSAKRDRAVDASGG